MIREKPPHGIHAEALEWAAKWTNEHRSSHDLHDMMVVAECFLQFLEGKSDRARGIAKAFDRKFSQINSPPYSGYIKASPGVSIREVDTSNYVCGQTTIKVDNSESNLIDAVAGYGSKVTIGP